jgi:hypothetical protein
MRSRGRPRETAAQRLIRRRQREAQRRQFQATAQHLRNAAARLAAQGPQRSLRIEWRRDNRDLIAAGQAPWYRLALFGEEDYYRQGFPPDGYRIVAGDDGDNQSSDDDDTTA